MATTVQSNKTVRQIMPTIINDEAENHHRQLRVAAYCRVSTDSDEQEMSFDAQVEFYTDKIMRNPEWCLAGIYADMYNQRLIQCPAHGSVGKCLK